MGLLRNSVLTGLKWVLRPWVLPQFCIRIIPVSSAGAGTFRALQGRLSNSGLAMVVKIEFQVNVPAGDSAVRPVTILGKKRNLESVSFAQVSPYLGDKVTKEVTLQ